MSIVGVHQEVGGTVRVPNALMLNCALECSTMRKGQKRTSRKHL